MKYFRLHKIKWDTNGRKADLPSEVIAEVDDSFDPTEDAADLLSDIFGFCVFGLQFTRLFFFEHSNKHSRLIYEHADKAHGKSGATKTIIGRQYGYRSSAMRAISRFQVRYFATIPKHFQFWVNKIDEGCFEVDGKQD